MFTARISREVRKLYTRKLTMTQYIDKAAVVAEIEKLISSGKIKCQQSQENNDQVSYIAWSEHIATCGKILSFLDTLEIKEGDLEKEIQNSIYHQFFDLDGIAIKGTSGYATVEDMASIARHFFELGLNTKKSDQLTEKDIATIYNLMVAAIYEQRCGYPSFDGKDIYEEVLKRFNAQKEK